MTTILTLILMILMLLMICFLYVKNKIESFSQKWFGTKDLLEGVHKQKIEMQETPKNPYGLDSLLLPEIAKDFPNLNMNEMKKMAENSIILCFKAIENKKVEGFFNANEKVLNDLQSKIDDLKDNSITISIRDIKLHKTVINQYDREESKCRLVFQTAVGYKVSKNGDIQRKEDRFNTEFVYIYNYKNIESHESISLQCPNCGAPIQHLGVKVCPYCNAGIIDLATKTWKLNDINKIQI